MNAADNFGGAETAVPGNARRVLIVEDEAMIAMMLEDMLDMLGFEVAGVAASVGQAVQLLESSNPAPDLALLDINLGGERVFPVADQLLARQIPFAFCSGYGAGAMTGQYANTQTIPKPFRLETLKAVLQQLRGGA